MSDGPISQAQETELRRAGIRQAAGYVRNVLAKNHPHLRDAYEHAAWNIEHCAEMYDERLYEGLGQHDPH